MKQIKAINTKYNGRLFRSRLEARWAVFFDSMRIDYEYEYEGIVLESGPYLPDFWLPEFKVFFEIKPFGATAEEISKARNLTKESGYAVCVTSGSPCIGFDGLCFSYADIHNENINEDEFCTNTAWIVKDSFCFGRECNNSEDPFLVFESWFGYDYFYKTSDHIFLRYPPRKILQPFDDDDFMQSSYEQVDMNEDFGVPLAIKNALSARFGNGVNA